MYRDGYVTFWTWFVVQLLLIGLWDANLVIKTSLCVPGQFLTVYGWYSIKTEVTCAHGQTLLYSSSQQYGIVDKGASRKMALGDAMTMKKYGCSRSVSSQCKSMYRAVPHRYSHIPLKLEALTAFHSRGGQVWLKNFSCRLEVPDLGCGGYWQRNICRKLLKMEKC